MKEPIMTKGSWLSGWVAGGQSSMNFIAFTDSSSPSTQSILKEKKVSVWGEVIQRGTALRKFSGKPISLWSQRCDVEKGTLRQEVTFPFHLFFSFFQFPKKVPGVCSLSNPWEPSFEPNPLSPLLTQPCWIYPALLSTSFLDILTASDDYGCNSLWGFAAPLQNREWKKKKSQKKK